MIIEIATLYAFGCLLDKKGLLKLLRIASHDDSSSKSSIHFPIVVRVREDYFLFE